MRNLLAFLLGGIFCPFLLPAQVTVTGTSSATSVPVNAPGIVVDNAVTITSGLTFNNARVSVATNFNTGDVLSYTAALPQGVSASYNTSTGVLSFSGSASAAAYQDLFRSVTFNTSSTNVQQRTVLFEVGDGTVKFNSANGHYYLSLAGSYNWTSAKTEAENVSRRFFGLQGYLATVTSLSESNFVNALANKGWLGGSDEFSQINAATGTNTFLNQAASEGKWYWVTGPERGTQFSNGSTVITWANWNTGEPNNSSGAEHFVENAWAAGGKWNDASASNTSGLVIEYGDMPGDPVVDVWHSRDIRLIATSIRATGTNLAYSLTAPAVVVDNNLTLYSSGNITNARVTVSSGFRSGDVLSYTGSLPSGVTAGYNTSTGVLSFTGTATASQWQTLLRTVRFNSSSYVVGNRTVTFSVGNLVSGSNGHFYEFVTPAASWTTARSNAAARTYLGLQGYLATITDATENEFIKQTLSADGWIGASDDFNQVNAALGTSTYANQGQAEGKWYWVTGPERGMQLTTANAANGSSYPPVFGSAYNNWNIGEPNNYWDGSANEHFAEIYSTGTSPGRWNDNREYQSRGYVVEYGGLGTDPLLELSSSRTLVITSVLPASGLQFSVSKKNHVAELAWSTLSESNTKYFEVLHSTDGSNYSKIGEKPAAINSSTLTRYFFVHTGTGAGTNYYKLKLVDQDGRTTSSAVKTVQFDVAGFTLAPNPARDWVVVSSPFSQPSQLEIRNAAGIVVLRQSINYNQNRVGLGQLSAGMYYAEIINGSSRSAAVPFIKE